MMKSQEVGQLGYRLVEEISSFVGHVMGLVEMQDKLDLAREEYGEPFIYLKIKMNIKLANQQFPVVDKFMDEIWNNFKIIFGINLKIICRIANSKYCQL